MFSTHRQFIKTRKELHEEKAEALETLRKEYLEACEKVLRQYTQAILHHSQTGHRELHG